MREASPPVPTFESRPTATRFLHIWGDTKTSVLFPTLTEKGQPEWVLGCGDSAAAAAGPDSD